MSEYGVGNGAYPQSGTPGDGGQAVPAVRIPELPPALQHPPQVATTPGYAPSAPHAGSYPGSGGQVDARRSASAVATRRQTEQLGPLFAGRPAGAGRRLTAFTVDAIVVAAVAVAVGLLAGSTVYAAVAVVEVVVAGWVLQARAGLTLGGALVGIRTSRRDRPYSPGAGRAFARGFITALGGLYGLVGAWVVVASSAWDASGLRRSWADRAAQTVVVAVPRRRGAAAPGAGASVSAIPVPPVAAGRPYGPPASVVQPYGAPAPVANPYGVPAPAVPVAPATHFAPAGPAAIPAAIPGSAAIPGTGAAGAGILTPQPFQPEPVARPGDVGAAASRTGAPRSGPQPVAPARPATPASRSDDEALDAGALLLVFDTGQRVRLPIPVAANLGRSPAPTEPGDRLVTVDDHESTVSKTHARLEHSRGRTWITDGGSTNGTEVLSEDAGRVTLAAGVRQLLDEGDRVRIGNRTFTISVLLGADPAGENHP